MILFFVKHPEPGQVKTRLGREMGMENAALLYRAMVGDMLGKLRQWGEDLSVCFAPAGKEADIASLLGPGLYLAQEGPDLGERMENAFARVFDQGARQAFLIGSDIPEIQVEYLRDAQKRLQYYDCVLGPARDGGYFLIGFTKKGFCPAAFSGPAWSTSRVLEQTVRILESHGRAFHLMPPQNDVDSMADLEALARRLKQNPDAAPLTAAWVQENQDSIRFPVKTNS